MFLFIYKPVELNARVEPWKFFSVNTFELIFFRKHIWDYFFRPFWRVKGDNCDNDALFGIKTRALCVMCYAAKTARSSTVWWRLWLPWAWRKTVAGCGRTGQPSRRTSSSTFDCRHKEPTGRGTWRARRQPSWAATSGTCPRVGWSMTVGHRCPTSPGAAVRRPACSPSSPGLCLG